MEGTDTVGALARASTAHHDGVAAAPQPDRKTAARSDGKRARGAVRKAAAAADCETLEQLPNIGPSLARDLRSIGVEHPRDLASRNGFALYRALCEKTGRRQDPCVLDTFLAATDFMRGAPAAPWWAYTARRKREFEGV